MERDTRFSNLFNEFIHLEYGTPGEDFFFKVVGETYSHYYMELISESGTEQLVYDKKEHKWHFIS